MTIKVRVTLEIRSGQPAGGRVFHPLGFLSPLETTCILWDGLNFIMPHWNLVADIFFPIK